MAEQKLADQPLAQAVEETAKAPKKKGPVKAVFVSTCLNLRLVVEPADQIVHAHGGRVVPIRGKDIKFGPHPKLLGFGVFVTGDKEEIDFIRNHELYGKEISEPFSQASVETKRKALEAEMRQLEEEADGISSTESF